MIRGKAPFRISFAGGGTDINEVFEKYGGAVINTTIDKYIYMTVMRMSGHEIYINRKQIRDAHPFTKKIIEKLNPKIGLDLYYHSDIPPGRGLGSSSTYSVLMAKMIYEIQGIKKNEIDLVNETYGIESEIGKCGWQDQYSIAFGGINYIEFSKDEKNIYPLRLKNETIRELESHLLLVDTKKEHDAKKIEARNVHTFTEQKAKEMIKQAQNIRNLLINNDIFKIGECLNLAWELKRNDITSNSEINRLYDFGINNGATGGKLLGAGDGGHLLFFIFPLNRGNLMNEFQLQGYNCFCPNLTEKGAETWSL